MREDGIRISIDLWNALAAAFEKIGDIETAKTERAKAEKWTALLNSGDPLPEIFP